MQVHTGKNTRNIARVQSGHCRWNLPTAAILETDMIVFSADTPARQPARDAELAVGERGGIVIDYTQDHRL